MHHLAVDGRNLVVLTTEGGANRVYAAGEYRFGQLASGRRVVDSMGREWTIDEDALRATFEAGLRLPRVAAHRAFWFGWYAQYPTTVLIR